MVDVDARTPDVDSLKAALVNVQDQLLQEDALARTARTIRDGPAWQLWCNGIFALLTGMCFDFGW